MRNNKSIAGKIVRIILCILFCMFAAIPIYEALIVSLTPYSHLLEAQLVPHYFELSNFTSAFGLIAGNVLNSFFYACCATVLTTLISIPAAYVLSRYRFKLRQGMLFILLLTQMMAGIVILPTLYRMFQSLGILNSRGALVLVLTGINLALVVTILHGYFSTLPAELEEAAALDGCSYIQLLVRVIFPISGPGIAVGAIFVFINSYNEFVVPLFLRSDAKKDPLTLVVYSLLSDTTIRWHIMAAASLIGIIPPVVIFTFFQKYIIQGVTSGAVKG